MMRPRDPRLRQRINQISHNLESANETAQEGLYALSQNYISPCLAAIGNCVYACTAPCFPSREDQLRRRRRGRAESIFDFYDDWENDEPEDGLLGWGTGELDRLLAGSGLTHGSSDQPRRPRKMSYGTRGTRRRSTVHIPDSRDDPTVIPSSSILGFLERFPWRFGARGVKYRPSAAGLQEHPGGLRHYAQEEEPLMEVVDEEGGRVSYSPNGRDRSATQSSRETANSLSSRGDLIPSDEEEDAVPLDDEFAIVFGRRGTLLESDDQSGAKSENTRSASGTSSLGGASSKKQKRKKKRSSTKSPGASDTAIVQVDAPSMTDLKIEEQQVALEEESAIERKRAVAHELALNQGLESGDADKFVASIQPPGGSSITLASRPSDGSSHHLRQSRESFERRLSVDQTEPFPPLSPSFATDSPRPSSLHAPSNTSKTAERDPNASK